MSDPVAEQGLATWTEQMRMFDGLAERLAAKWRPEGASVAEIQDMNKLVLSMVASGYLCHVYTDARRPVFMPMWNYAFNQGGPDPDYVYSSAEIDPGGTYRISGYRGTGRFIQIVQRKTMFWGTSREAGGSPLSATLDLDDLHIGKDGYFSVVVSGERPEGWTGDWWHLDPRATVLWMRRCVCDWNREADAAVAIGRIDGGGGDMPPEAVSRRFSELAELVEGEITAMMDLTRWYREHHGLHVLLHSGRVGLTKDDNSAGADRGGGVVDQAYYDGAFELGDSEALIVEFKPPQCRYWQILVADDRYATVDWVNRQSSLNDVQARLDSDGVFRAVVSKQDPGVPNWLDKADVRWGILQARFLRPSSFPDATVAKVAVADVRKHLPAATPAVGPEERQEKLRLRREGAQLRRIW